MVKPIDIPQKKRCEIQGLTRSTLTGVDLDFPKCLMRDERLRLFFLFAEHHVILGDWLIFL